MDNRLKIVYVETGALTPYARNARKHTPEQVEQIKESIKRFGWTVPVIIDGSKGIIAGHGRVMAALGLGIDKIPCVEVSHLTEKQKRAYILADNKIAENADWDEAVLKIELEDLIDVPGFPAITAEEETTEPILEEIPLPAPEYTWVLIGIPTKNLGTIQDELDRIAVCSAVSMEMAVSDGQ